MCTEKEQGIACRISEVLNLLNTSSLASHLTRNKHQLKELLNENNISKVNYAVYYRKEQLVNFGLMHGFLFIVKLLD
ncbi:hypothetical protein [Abyssisolibacter fermentans]|uniref:hypothetical protein n=1 Tax=Abyssisolibacter fermentans TaxID=1766203 RepID=UPI00138F897E|nr:hypothetical protein [Abyssisolibacter fermentans]